MYLSSHNIARLARHKGSFCLSFPPFWAMDINALTSVAGKWVGPGKKGGNCCLIIQGIVSVRKPYSQPSLLSENIYFTLLKSFLLSFTFFCFSSIFPLFVFTFIPKWYGSNLPHHPKRAYFQKIHLCEKSLVETITGSHTKDEKFPGQLSCLDPFPLSLAVQVQRFRYAGWPGSNIVQKIFVIKVFATKTGSEVPTVPYIVGIWPLPMSRCMLTEKTAATSWLFWRNKYRNYY
jgi:hypothetical protein